MHFLAAEDGILFGAPNILKCHGACLGFVFLQLRAHSALRITHGRCDAVQDQPLRASGAALHVSCQPFSWLWLHATAANMDRVCSDALSEHAQPVVDPMRWSEPAGGSRVRGSHHVHRSGRKSPRKGCAGREVHRRSERGHMREQLGQCKRSRDAARARAAAAVPDPAGPAPTAVSELDTAIGRRPS